MLRFRRAVALGTCVTVAMLLVGATEGAGTAATATPADTWTCASPNCPITVNDHIAPPNDQAASPYPSNICCIVSDPPAVIDTLTVSLTGLTHGSLDNVDVLLVSANDQAVELMSDVGGSSAVSNLNLTFDDSAAASLPLGTPPSSGTYRPTNYPGTATPCVADNPPAVPNADPFPAPAPAAPGGGYAQTLGTYHGIAFSGFRLYVGDDCGGGTGSITSWSFNVTYVPTAATLISLSGGPVPRGMELRWKTASEVDVLGFNMFRTAGGTTAKLNGPLILARSSGAVAGATYRFLDRRARKAGRYVYRLQIVTRSGARRWAGLSFTEIRR